MGIKRKIINDPVFGFINLPTGFLYEIYQHPYLYRLNRIKQLGLSSMVYPGATHCRFQHITGAMYLVTEAILQLRLKGHEITEEEAEGLTAAVMLHDIGHGPFSHVLESVLFNEVSHEEISLRLMQRLNREMGGRLDTCISIFTDSYPKRFLHQLISSQLDVDRLDYLCRDSFFTGVVEGNIDSARIIKMLNVVDDRLVVEAKGIYSIENFLMARRLMYWQVYLHKTSLAAEKMLINLLRRAKELTAAGEKLSASPALAFFLEGGLKPGEITEVSLDHFLALDDYDVWSAVKAWQHHPDLVLSTLCRDLLNRRLFKMELTDKAPAASRLAKDLDQLSQRLGITLHEAGYFTASNDVSNKIYDNSDYDIEILYNDGSIRPVTQASDILNIDVLSKKAKKHAYAYLR
ncbi:MAG: HD domain-containing protein [Bacteroidales bacterium]|nr:HD domain-containing protein [Bacteroidales bacterium]